MTNVINCEIFKKKRIKKKYEIKQIKNFIDDCFNYSIYKDSCGYLYFVIYISMILIFIFWYINLIILPSYTVISKEKNDVIETAKNLIEDKEHYFLVEREVEKILKNNEIQENLINNQVVVETKISGKIYRTIPELDEDLYNKVEHGDVLYDIMFVKKLITKDEVIYNMCLSIFKIEKIFIIISLLPIIYTAFKLLLFRKKEYTKKEE